VPVAAIGIAGYTLLLALALLGARRLLLLFAFGGFCYALYLTHIEKSVLMVWCLYCVCSQVIIALLTLGALAWLFTGRRRPA
jgi:vitamin-K-epoxide reductase (warfarin-sensitive)